MSGVRFNNYSAVLNELKEKIKQARIKAALTVNKELGNFTKRRSSLNNLPETLHERVIVYY